MNREEALALSDIHYLPFPYDVSGCVMPSHERYLIGINAALSEEQKQEAIDHELAHILLDHFSDDRLLSEIEAEADRFSSAL